MERDDCDNCNCGQAVDEWMNRVFNKCITKKEVKKLSRPYLETKVVKVKKKKESSNQIVIDGKKYTLCKEEYLHKEKGNWVNGENLDKIKFPCFCRWSDNGWVGMLIKDYVNNEPRYTIARIDRQNKQSETYGSFESLKEMIKDYDIHILKGKIIIFEEEEK